MYIDRQIARSRRFGFPERPAGKCIFAAATGQAGVLPSPPPRVGKRQRG